MALSSEILHLSLCAGAGGLDIGLEFAFGLIGARLRTVCYVEREAYAAATLVARMEDAALGEAPIWDDLKTFDGKPWRGIVDCVSAGYPCQPFSCAGKKLGKHDPRHLWPDLDRILGETQPSIFFGENVDDHLRMGFGTVRRNLQGRGYRVSAGLFSASEIGAPHERQRLFILAHRPGVFGCSEFGSEPDGIHAAMADGAGERCGERRESSARERRDGQLDGNCKTLDDPDGARSNDERKRTDSGQGRRQRLFASAGGDMADAGSERCQGHGEAGTKAGTTGRSGGTTMADAELDGRPQCCPRSGAGTESDAADDGKTALADAGYGRHFGEADEIRARGDTIDNENESIPIFPPFPEDANAWKRIIEIAPHLEPAVCRMANGLAYRVDRLRLTGNGVVPLAAAYAFLSLAAVATSEGLNVRNLETAARV